MLQLRTRKVEYFNAIEFPESSTWAELTRLSADVDNCRIGLAAGDPKAARDLVKKVHSIIRAENESWAS